MAGTFNLKWSDYLSNVAEKFSSLRREDDFFDVSLVCCDKRQVSAHRVILSSCSEYFKTILKNNNKTSSTILCLENIYFEELNQILDYVYKGEVEIKEDQLEKFLKIAQRFQLEGLLSDGSEEDEAEEEESAYTSCSIPKNHINASIKTENGGVNQQTNVLKEQIIINSEKFQLEGLLSDGSEENKTEEKEPAHTSCSIPKNHNNAIIKNENVGVKLKTNVLKDPIIISSEKFYNTEELDEKIKGYIYKNDGSGTKKYGCAICNKLSRDFNDSKKHVEVHFDGLCFPCQTCDKTFRSRNALKSHRSAQCKNHLKHVKSKDIKLTINA